MALSVKLTCNETPRPAVQDFSSFMWGLSLIHDRVMLLWDNPTNPILYSPDFYRNWRRMPNGMELRLGFIHKQSPLSIELIITTVGGFIVAAKSVVEIYKIAKDWNLDKENKEWDNILKRIEVLERLEALKKASKDSLISLDSDIHRLLEGVWKLFHTHIGAIISSTPVLFLRL